MKPKGVNPMKRILTALAAATMLLTAIAAPASANPPPDYVIVDELPAGTAPFGEVNINGVELTCVQPSPVYNSATGVVEQATLLCLAGNRITGDNPLNDTGCRSIPLVTGDATAAAESVVVCDQATPVTPVTITSAPASSVPAGPTADQLAFTGAESTVLAYFGAGAVAFGALALGTRRRFFNN